MSAEPAQARPSTDSGPFLLAIDLRRPSDRPGLHDQRTATASCQYRIEHVERVDRLDAFHHVDLAHAIQGSGGEPAGIDVAALVHEGLQLLVVAEGARERLVTDLWVAAGSGCHQRAGTVEHQVGVEALSVDAGCREHVDQPYRALERHRVHEDEGLFPRFRLDVLEDLVLVIYDRITFADALTHDLCHGQTSSLLRLNFSKHRTARPSRAVAEVGPTAGGDFQAWPAPPCAVATTAAFGRPAQRCAARRARAARRVTWVRVRRTAGRPAPARRSAGSARSCAVATEKRR